MPKLPFNAPNSQYAEFQRQTSAAPNLAALKAAAESLAAEIEAVQEASDYPLEAYLDARERIQRERRLKALKGVLPASYAPAAENSPRDCRHCLFWHRSDANSGECTFWANVTGSIMTCGAHRPGNIG